LVELRALVRDRFPNLERAPTRARASSRIELARVIHARSSTPHDSRASSAAMVCGDGMRTDQFDGDEAHAGAMGAIVSPAKATNM